MRGIRALIALSLVVTALAVPAVANAGNPAQTSRLTDFQSLSRTGPMPCDETRVVNTNQTKETVRCWDLPQPPKSAQQYSGLWYSDFPWVQATDVHFVLTASGNLDGWATC
jgi:hypothetical protein